MVEKSKVGRTHSRKTKEAKETYHQRCPRARGSQRSAPPPCQSRRNARFELGHEGGLPRLGLVLRLLEQLLLLGQLRRQQIALFGEPAALLFLGTTSSVGLAQLLLTGGVGA